MKKIIAFACTLVMLVSLFAVTNVSAAGEKATITLEFAGYETAGTAANPVTFAKIDVKATIPDTLVPYEVVAADWIETFEDSYKGLMIQGIGVDIPNVEGLQYIESKSSKADFITITNNTTAGQISVSYTATGSYDTYYTGELGTLATICYRITGDANGTYAVNMLESVAEIGLVSIDATTGAATPFSYIGDNLVRTNAVVKPAPTTEYEDKDIVTRVVADTTDIELADVKYTNVAKYVGTINFDTIKAAFTGEEALNNEAGIMVNGVKKYQFPNISAASEGSVTYSVLFYGITPAEAADLNVSTYYNAHVVKAAN